MNQIRSDRTTSRGAPAARLLPRAQKIFEDFVRRVEAGELPEVSSDPGEMERLLGLAAELDAHARRSALELASALSDEELREICEIRRYARARDQ